MTPTPTRPEPTTPTREAIRNEALEEAALVADDYYVASAQQEGSFDHKYAAETIAENIRSLKQHLTSEPAASVPVTREQLGEFLYSTRRSYGLPSEQRAWDALIKCGDAAPYLTWADAILALWEAK
jgi:hypothetical protein